MRKVYHVSTIGILVLMFAGLSARAEDREYLRRPVPGAWTYDGAMEQVLPSDDPWWKSFGDAALDSLIAIGERNNYDVAMAARRREIARLAVKQTQSALYPTVSANAGYTRLRQAGSDANDYTLQGTVTWEVDLFGRISSKVKASKASYDASRAEYMATMVSVTADIASYYMQCRMIAMELKVAREHLQSQKRVMEITEARFNAGLVSKLDVAQAKVVYYNTEASIPSLQNSYNQTLNALALLLGLYPDDVTTVVKINSDTLSEFTPIIPAGIPADLLRRRPDIVAAEYEIASYAAQVGIAKKDFMPTLALNGSIGVSSGKIDKLFSSSGLGYSVGPTLTWTIFDGMARKYALAAARQQMENAVDNYNLTVITAVDEVNNALSAYRADTATLAIQRKAVEQSREAFELSIDLYKQGLTSFTNVVSAQIDWLSAANSLVVATGNVNISLINIYKALGGSPTV